MLRSILHCDMNNFYASVECMLDPALKKYPIAVCGSVEERHGIVLAKNYKAKAFDVKTGDAVWQAKQKCKDLVVVPPHYEEYISEQFHRELITPFVDPFEQAEEERIEEEKEQLRQLEIAKVRKVLEMLKPVQRERLIKAILLGMSSRKIAKEEGVYYSVVDKSIAAARKNFKKFYENL